MKKNVLLLSILSIALAGCEGSIFSDKKSPPPPASPHTEEIVVVAPKHLEDRPADRVIGHGRNISLPAVYELFRFMAPGHWASDDEMDKLHYAIRIGELKNGVQIVRLSASPLNRPGLDKITEIKATQVDDSIDATKSIYLVASEPKYPDNRLVFRLEKNKSGQWTGWAKHEGSGIPSKKYTLSTEYSRNLSISVE